LWEGRRTVLVKEPGPGAKKGEREYSQKKASSNTQVSGAILKKLFQKAEKIMVEPRPVSVLEGGMGLLLGGKERSKKAGGKRRKTTKNIRKRSLRTDRGEKILLSYIIWVRRQ